MLQPAQSGGSDAAANDNVLSAVWLMRWCRDFPVTWISNGIRT